MICRQLLLLDAGSARAARWRAESASAARSIAGSAVQGSDNPGADIPRATRQGSDNPPVARTGSDNPGSDNPRVASPRTNGSSVSVLPQAPEEAVHRSAGWDRSYQARGTTVPLAIEARPVAVAEVVPEMSRGSSSRAPTRTPEARAGGPTNLDEFVNEPEYGPEGGQEDVDVESGRDPKRRKLIHHASRRVTGKAAPDFRGQRSSLRVTGWPWRTATPDLCWKITTMRSLPWRRE